MLGLAPDEPRLKKLGDAMAAATGYTSQYGWELYDTSGMPADLLQVDVEDRRVAVHVVVTAHPEQVLAVGCEAKAGCLAGSRRTGAAGGRP